MVMMMTIACPAYAEESTMETNNYNNNYLGIGSPGLQQSETEINSHLQPMVSPLTITPEYSGPVFKDHKFQKTIMDFLLREDGLKPFKVEKRGWFVLQSSKSSSDIITKGYPEQTRIYVFRDLEDLKKIKGFKVVGYIDTYSKSSETLMDCFDQAVIDTGEMGGNILVILKVDFMAGLKSTTVGLGTSGAGGFLHGGNGASVYGGAIGYASSKATPQTNPYIHGIALYSEELVK